MSHMPDEVKAYLTSPSFAEAAAEHFHSIDTESKGSVTFDKMTDVAREALSTCIAFEEDGRENFQCQPSDADLHRFIQIFDADNNGVIDLQEFIAFLKFALARLFLESEVKTQIISYKRT